MNHGLDGTDTRGLRDAPPVAGEGERELPGTKPSGGLLLPIIPNPIKSGELGGAVRSGYGRISGGEHGPSTQVSWPLEPASRRGSRRGRVGHIRHGGLPVGGPRLGVPGRGAGQRAPRVVGGGLQPRVSDPARVVVFRFLLPSLRGPAPRLQLEAHSRLVVFRLNRDSPGLGPPLKPLRRRIRMRNHPNYSRPSRAT